MNTTQYVIVVRHGQTIPNLLLEQAAESYYYAVTGADVSIGLTGFGFLEVEHAALFLAGFLQNKSVKRIFCSQFLRTRSTAEVIQSFLPEKPAIIEDSRIAKRHYGDFWNITYNGVKALYPEEYLQFCSQGGYLYRPPGGENYIDLKARLLSFVRDEIDSTDDNICICTHSASALMLEQLLVGQMSDLELVERYDAIAVPNASVMVYSRKRARRILGFRMPAISWFKRLVRLEQTSWKKLLTFVPELSRAEHQNIIGAAVSVVQDVPHDHDSIIDKENRVA